MCVQRQLRGYVQYSMFCTIDLFIALHWSSCCTVSSCFSQTEEGRLSLRLMKLIQETCFRSLKFPPKNYTNGCNIINLSADRWSVTAPGYPVRSWAWMIVCGVSQVLPMSVWVSFVWGSSVSSYLPKPCWYVDCIVRNLWTADHHTYMFLMNIALQI